LGLSVFWKKSWRKAVSLSIALGSFLASAWNLVLGYRFHIRGDLSVSRFGNALGGTFGQPNFLAGYLLVTLPFILLKLDQSQKRAKLFWFLVLTCQLFALILTLSRAAYVGATFVLLGWLVLRRTKGSWWGKKMVAVSAALMIIVFATVAFLPRQMEIRPDLVEQRTRERILAKGLKAFMKRPLLGWGWANFDYAFEATDWPKKLTIDVYVDKAHSSFIEILVTLGVSGFLVYVMMLKRIFQKLYFSDETDWWRQSLFLAFLVLVFHSQTNIVSIGEEALFWLILGIVGAEA
jgi:O-antigen ligase